MADVAPRGAAPYEGRSLDYINCLDLQVTTGAAEQTAI